MTSRLRSLLTARAPYFDTRATLRTYLVLWTVFVVGMTIAAGIQVVTGALNGPLAAVERYGPSLLGVTIALVLASSLNVAVNQGRRQRR